MIGVFLLQPCKHFEAGVYKQGVLYQMLSVNGVAKNTLYLIKALEVEKWLAWKGKQAFLYEGDSGTEIPIQEIERQIAA